jgi:hypothetical protein
MSMLESFVTLVSGATVAGERIYPQVAPDGVVRPFIVYQRINTNTENVLSGSTGLRNTRLQVDVFATTYVQAQQITTAIENLMGSWSTPNVCVVSQDFYEDEVKLYRVMTDFSIWHDT